MGSAPRSEALRYKRIACAYFPLPYKVFARLSSSWPAWVENFVAGAVGIGCCAAAYEKRKMNKEMKIER